MKKPWLIKKRLSERPRLWLGCCVMLFSVQGVNVYAQEAIAWEDLSGEEQLLLKQVERRWELLSLERQVELRDGAQRWLKMDPDEREMVRQRQQSFQRRSAQERERIVRRFQQFNNAPPAQQRRLKEAQERFRQLPRDDREELRQRFESLRQQQEQGSADNTVELLDDEAKEPTADSSAPQIPLLRPNPPRFERLRPQGDGRQPPRPPRQH